MDDKHSRRQGRAAPRAAAAWIPIAPGFGRLWTTAILLPLVCLAAAGWGTWDNVIASSRSQMARSVGMVHEQVLRLLETQEAVLIGMDSFVTGMTWDEMRRNRGPHDFARRIIEATPTVLTLGVVDPTGHIAVASESPTPPSQLVLTDRDFVRAFPPGSAARGTYIGAVVISRVDGRVQVHASRPHLDAAGRADGGVIVSAFPPGYFETFFADIAETPTTGFAVLRDDGSILASYPTPVRREAQQLDPDDLARTAVALAAGPGNPGRGVRFAERGSLFGGLELVAARPVTHYGLSIVHRLDPTAVQLDWVRQMVPSTLGAFAAMALLVLLTARAQSRTVRAQADLQQRTAAAEAAQARAQERAEIEGRLRQTEKVAALGQLAAGVAHDFNNLLQTIVLNADMLEQTAPNLPEASRPAVQRAAGLIVRASERAIALTRRMLDYARREEAAAGTSPRLDVPAALRSVHELLGRSLGTQYRIRLDTPAAELPAGRGTEAEFESVVINLVVNARDAMPKGGEIVIEARAVPLAAGEHADLDAGTYLRIVVRDTGRGMDSATLAHAGEAFFTTKERGQGTGLGLSMARGFARRVGGALDLDSTPGRGTTVTLWMPAV